MYIYIIYIIYICIYIYIYMTKKNETFKVFRLVSSLRNLIPFSLFRVPN